MSHNVEYDIRTLLLLRQREQWQSIVMSTSVCLSVHEHISGATRAIFTNFVCLLPMAVARSFSQKGTMY